MVENQEKLLNEKELRESVIDRLEVLDSVGEILLLPNTEFATTEMVANYYKVEKKTLQKLVERNRKELNSDGLLNKTYKEIKVLVNTDNMSTLKLPPKGTLIFPKRAILRVGMLLRDSEVAKEIRTKLLDIVHDAEKGEGNIDNIVDEINEEKTLQMDLGIAICSGDMNKVIDIQTKLNDMKNKRIVQLEKENEIIINNSLTIKESQSVINRIIRNIAYKCNNGNIGRVWNEFYSKINYKLHINVKAREKKNKKDSYIKSLNEKEIAEAEKIARCWAVDLGIDLDKILKLG